MKLARGIAILKAWFRHRAHPVPIDELSDEDHVKAMYLELLRRPIDAQALIAWRAHLLAGTYSRQGVVDVIRSSIEYRSQFVIDVVGIIHHSRQLWIRDMPAYGRVLDIGGSSATRAEGALIELGYSHRPRRLDILDLPPDKQYWGKPTYDQSKASQFDWGEVTYFHGSAEKIQDVAPLQSRTYDCVFLGQAIEHIYPESLPALLAWVKDHLAPGGCLIFDTPNRLLTKIQCPDSLIDPDHKYEYTPVEMTRVVERAGFEVTKKVGMVHLPVQAASKIYDVEEFAAASLLSGDVDACYLFAFEARPSSNLGN